MVATVMQQTACKTRGLQFKVMLQYDFDLNSSQCCIRTMECGESQPPTHALVECFSHEFQIGRSHSLMLQRAWHKTSVNSTATVTITLAEAEKAID